MMEAVLEVPDLESLRGLGLEVEQLGSREIVRVTVRSDDGDDVTLTWDEIARSAQLSWTRDEQECAVMQRETVTQVTVNRNGAVTFISIATRSAGLGGRLLVTVGKGVSISDALLRM